MRKIHFTVIYLLLFCCASVYAQNITISGTVTEASTSEPLTGVSIRVDGTSTGTVTGIDGDYSLSAPANASLTFSYIGYATKVVAVKNQTVINVSLDENLQDLDEVIIVGVSLRKSDLTGSVGSVSSKVLEEKPVTNINQAIQGRVAGVLINNGAKPGDDSNIKIRGINTINGTTDPIYVVDGLVMDNFGGGFNAVNLNDVASIEILKDASATALYGSRAANGVVLITTKKGKKGEGKVSYDGWVGVRSYANTPDKMNSRQLFELRRDAALNSYKANYPNATQTDINAFLENRVMTPYDPVSGSGGFVFGQYELDAYNNPAFKDYDWLDEVTRNGVEQNHAVSFTGGGDNGAFYLSFGYSKQEGMVKKLGDEKYSGRINADYNVKPWLKVGTNTSFVRTDSEIFDNDDVFDKARGANPMLPINNNLTLNYGDFYDQNYFNPLNTLKIDDNRIRNRIISSNFLNINPLNGLNFRTTFSMNFLEESRLRYVPNDIQQAIRYAHNGEARHTRDQRMMWQWDNTLSYDKTFGIHRINATIGTSVSKINRNYTEATGRGFDNNIFTYHNLGASNFLANRSIGSDFTASSLMSYFVRANYTYAGKYYATATARYDGSSKFSADNRWGLFPSFSLAWNVAEEGFMQDQQIFDLFKARLGFGMVGNQEIDDYSYLTLYSASVTEGQTTYVPREQKGNGKISWESQRQFNFGVDMGVLSNKVRMSVDLFHITNDDLLMTRNINTSSGFKTMVENVGAIENKGLEVSLDVNAIDTKDFQWNVSANISADKNKVTKLYGENDYILKYDGDRNLQKEGNLFIGESRNTIYIWKTGGIAQEADMERLSQIDWSGRSVNPGDLYPLDVSGQDGTPDGKIDDYDRIIAGSTDPKFYGGFATDLTYRGITLNAVFNYSCGAKKLSYLYESMIGSTGRGLASVDLTDRWTPENTGARFPRPMMDDPSDDRNYNTFSAGNMDHSVQKASYLRLSALTLAYSLPRKTVNSLKLDNLRVYATASNLFCITPYKGYDPETGDWYPPTRMFVFGLNLAF
ncbi:MAG: TonB-dependent receptor [Tannerella sp.]|jgi:TonB-linked SusC/RagA family outer membrane protein|nr:TonB-dependent receptor [Tannerella sp.]